MSRSVTPQNNRDLNPGLLHLWSKFGGPSLMSYGAEKQVINAHTDGRMDTQTDTGNENARGQNWPRVKNNINGSICRKVYTGYRVSYDNTFIDDEINIYGHWHSALKHSGWSIAAIFYCDIACQRFYCCDTEQYNRWYIDWQFRVGIA